jgi:hypothetical protein
MTIFYVIYIIYNLQEYYSLKFFYIFLLKVPLLIFKTGLLNCRNRPCIRHLYIFFIKLCPQFFKIDHFLRLVLFSLLCFYYFLMSILGFSPFLKRNEDFSLETDRHKK